MAVTHWADLCWPVPQGTRNSVWVWMLAMGPGLRQGALSQMGEGCVASSTALKATAQNSTDGVEGALGEGRRLWGSRGGTVFRLGGGEGCGCLGPEAPTELSWMIVSLGPGSL